jgi:taurine--2-oxoglutarate transaminase
VAPENYWPELHRIARAQGVYLIADEVMSGFGRCGQWFAWQNYGLEHAPDIITCAKGLTGAALPLGAVIISEFVYDKIKHDMLFAGLTYCGHPMPCAVALAAIHTYRDEHLIERSQRLGKKLYADLQQLQQKHAVIGDVRGGDGLFAVLELVSERETKKALAVWPHMHPNLSALVREAMAVGVSFAARGNLLILAPPLLIDEQDLERALLLVDQLLTKYF